MSKPFSTTHTPKSLRKMSTLALARLFNHLYNQTFFNPYEERQYMLVVLIGHFDARSTDEIDTAKVERTAYQMSIRAQYEQMVTGRKYTDSQVMTIRAMREEGISFRALAAEFGGSLKGIEKLAKGITYTQSVGSFPHTISGMWEYMPSVKLTVRDEDTTDAWLTSLGF